MSTRGGTLAALLAALGRPSWWILALAGFLVRGGIVVFLLAIVSLPSPLALSNVLGPIVAPLYLGTIAPATAALIASAIVAVVVWIVVGSWFAAATEIVLVRDARQAAADDGLPAGCGEDPGHLVITRAAATHLLALVPLVVVAAIGSVQLVAVAYRELVNPSDSGPIVVRVIGGAWGPVLAILAAWILGEVVGGMAVRRVVLRSETVVGAVFRAAGDLVRHPAGALVAPLVTTAVLVADLGAVLAVVSLVWNEVRSRLVRPLEDPLATGLAVLTLGAAWGLALLVTGLIDAWRSTAITFEAERLAASAPAATAVAGDDGSQSGADSGGTIGASTHRRPGDWSADDRGGSL
jgi:hypothetical protein